MIRYPIARSIRGALAVVLAPAPAYDGRLPRPWWRRAHMAVQPLHLEVAEYTNADRWRWRLQEARGAFLADHAVALDRADPRYAALVVYRGIYTTTLRRTDAPPTGGG